MTTKTLLLFVLILFLQEKAEFPLAATEPVETKNSSIILYAKKRINSEGWSIYGISPDNLRTERVIPFSNGMGEYNPALSPNRTTILFNTYRYGGWKLATYDLKSKEVNRVTSASNYFTNGVYSPDGTRMVYEKNIGRSTHICMADCNGQNEVVLTSDKESWENRIPIWTPDGKAILYYSERNKVNDIFKLDIESGIQVNLTDNQEGNDFAPSISPDGKQIAFFSDRNGYLDLYLMDSDGNQQTLLTERLQNKNNSYNYYKDSNTYWVFKSAWSPDGKHLVFSNVTGDNIDLFTIERTGANIKNITNSPQSEYTPSWGRVKR